MNKDELLFIEQAGVVYRKMSLVELLGEENLLLRYKQRYKENITDELHDALRQEIERKLI